MTNSLLPIGDWSDCNWKKTRLWFSPVQSYVYFQSCRQDLQTLHLNVMQARCKKSESHVLKVV
jgi:hypothetical protein